jgi:hypothetical protein
MHAAMTSVAATGNSDADFVKLMIPHHQAAIDMAKTQLLYGKDPQMRREYRAVPTVLVARRHSTPDNRPAEDACERRTANVCLRPKVSDHHRAKGFDESRVETGERTG